MSGKTSIISEKELEELAEQAQSQLDNEDDIMALQQMLRMSRKEDLVAYLHDNPEMLPPLEEAINEDFAKYEVSKAAKKAAIEARNIIRKQMTLIRADERRALQSAARNATIKSSREREREGEGRKLYKTMNRKARKARKSRKARKARKARKN